jgi:guanosine-3',5'-bis(diphosphate) 3'-pyrophosphohydrolase
MTTLVQRAQQFATKAHEGQLRKYTLDPYIHHPEAVAAIVQTVSGHTKEQVAAAWLHDTVEDTDTTIEEIEQHFGKEVALLVSDLSDVSVASDGNRATRKTIDRAHTAQADVRSKTIKLADLIHNSDSIIHHDAKFATVFIAEKALLLDVLKEGNATLWDKAQHIVQGFEG